MGFLSAGVKGVSKIADNILKSVSDDPPFPSRKGSPLPPLTGDPRAAVTGAARREELIQKRKALAKKKSPVKGSVTKPKKANKNALDRILNTAQPGSDEWLGAFQDRYPGM